MEKRVQKGLSKCLPQHGNDIAITGASRNQNQYVNVFHGSRTRGGTSRQRRVAPPNHLLDPQ